MDSCRECGEPWGGPFHTCDRCVLELGPTYPWCCDDCNSAFAERYDAVLSERFLSIADRYRLPV